MRLTYWVAKCHNDSDCYSIRAKTKKACVVPPTHDPGDYDPPKKVTIEYADAFDLMEACLSGENRGDWER